MSHTMKIDAAFDAARPRDNYPIVVSREFLARPGHAYRIKARMRATHPEARVNLMLQGYEANVYFRDDQGALGDEIAALSPFPLG